MKDWKVAHQGEQVGIFDGIGCFIPSDDSKKFLEFAVNWFNKHKINGRHDVDTPWDECVKAWKQVKKKPK